MARLNGKVLRSRDKNEYIIAPHRYAENSITVDIVKNFSNSLLVDIFISAFSDFQADKACC